MKPNLISTYAKYDDKLLSSSVIYAMTRSFVGNLQLEGQGRSGKVDPSVIGMTWPGSNQSLQIHKYNKRRVITKTVSRIAEPGFAIASTANEILVSRRPLHIIGSIHD